MSIRSVGCVIIVFLLCSTATLHAMDIGIMAPTEQKFRAEMYYENYKREIKQDAIHGLATYALLKKEKRVLARVSFAPQRFWGFSLEAGGVDAYNSQDIAPIFGAGAHLVVLERGGFYASLFGKITWVTGIEYRSHQELIIPDNMGYTRLSYVRDEGYIEYATGLQVGHKWTPCTWAEVTSYAGAMVSFIDDTKSDEKMYVEDFRQGKTESTSMRASDLDMEEEHIFQAVVGVATTITPYDIGVRVEGRFYDRTSLSGSLFWNF